VRLVLSLYYYEGKKKPDFLQMFGLRGEEVLQQADASDQYLSRKMVSMRGHGGKTCAGAM